MSEAKGAAFDAVPASVVHGGDLDIKALNDGVVVHDQETGSTRRISASFAIDAEAERKLVWKFDTRILPLLACMYLFNSLDKSNLGNAKTAGLEKTLGLVGTQYNTILSIFYVPYVLTAPFLAIIGKKFGPSRVLPCMMATFGFMTLMVVAVKNFGGLIAVRWFLGMAESAFFPLVIYYQTTFYRRGELARRLAIFYAASSIASAFGGLLAYGVFQIKGGSIAPWRYLFVIEGAATMLFSLVAFLFLPYSAATAKFLTEEEKQLAFYRMQIDSSSVVGEKFNFKEAMRIFKQPTSYMILGIEMCLGVPLQSVSLFLPVITKALGYSTVKTNLYTVAPNITGAVMLLILAFASDYTRLRFPFVALGFAFTFVGFIIFASVNLHDRAAYFACFMMTWGTSAPSVILDTWFNNNIADENKRIVLTSTSVPLANLMGIVSENVYEIRLTVSLPVGGKHLVTGLPFFISVNLTPTVSSNIFLPKDAPKYVPALATTAAFGAFGCFLTLLLGSYMIIDNKRRDRRQGRSIRAKDIPTELLAKGPDSEDYRWLL